MFTFLRKTISRLYNAVSTTAVATQKALAERLQNIPETASLLYKRMTNNIEYERERLKDIIEKEAEEEAKEQQQDDMIRSQR